jgi:hypothetical protein
MLNTSEQIPAGFTRTVTEARFYQRDGRPCRRIGSETCRDGNFIGPITLVLVSAWLYNSFPKKCAFTAAVP